MTRLKQVSKKNQDDANGGRHSNMGGKTILKGSRKVAHLSIAGELRMRMYFFFSPSLSQHCTRDLSYNKLSSLSPGIFDPLTNLLRL